MEIMDWIIGTPILINITFAKAYSLDISRIAYPK